MDTRQRSFLDRLLGAAGPSGFETAVQAVWVEYVESFADEVHTDEYGNAVAVCRGSDPALAVAGHADEVGLMVAGVTDDGFVRVAPIGGADRTVSRGQHVDIHADDRTVPGVVGQTAVHLREEDDHADITEQVVDIGAADEAAARGLVEPGDPVTFATPVRELAGSRVAGAGMDDRVGIWVAAEALRRAGERDVEATVYAVSTVQEEVGFRGAEMVGFDLGADAAVAVDVTHAADNPAYPGDRFGEVALGAGPVVARGSANHPELVGAAREAAETGDIEVQLQAAGSRTGTDADAFSTAAGGTPALNLGVPNRYMHTPVEVVDTADLEAAADLLAGVAADGAPGDFAVDV